MEMKRYIYTLIHNSFQKSNTLLQVDLITFDAKHGSVGWFYGHGDYSFGDENHLPLDSDHSDTGLRSIKIGTCNLHQKLPPAYSFL